MEWAQRVAETIIEQYWGEQMFSAASALVESGKLEVMSG
jgi:hypothetical protein